MREAGLRFMVLSTALPFGLGSAGDTAQRDLPNQKP